MGNSYQDLDVWRLGIELAKDIYRLTTKLPKDELYGLTSQMRRASVSVPSNIAEGHRRGHTKQFVQYLRQASGSLAELETQLHLVAEIYGIHPEEKTSETLDALGRKLTTFIHTLLEKLEPNGSSLHDVSDTRYSILDTP